MLRKSLAAIALWLLMVMPCSAYTAYPSLSAGGSNTGLTTGSVIGYTVLATDGTTVITSRATAGIVEIGNGTYVISGGITVPSGTTYIVKWDRSDTSTVLGAAPVQGTSLGTDNATTLSAINTVTAATNTRVTTALPNVGAGLNGGLPLGDSSGRVAVGSYATGQDPWTLICAGIIPGSPTSGTGGQALASVLLVKAKTDNLPAQPASRSDVQVNVISH